MTRVYYKDAVGCFIVFDVTRASTFEAVIRWKQDLDSKVTLPDGSRIPVVLLANKVFYILIKTRGCGVAAKYHARLNIMLNFMESKYSEKII